jgi:MYXO-CTERM domain-containing protein
MKFRLLGAGVAVAASLMAPQQAHALIATTAYQPFKFFQNPIYNVPTGLTFANFNSTFGGPGTLTGVGFHIAGAADGSGTAMLGGNPSVANGAFTDAQASVFLAPIFNTLANGSNPLSVNGPIGAATPNPVNCIGIESCPTMGGNVIPLRSFRELDLKGNYAGMSGFASVTGAARTAYSTGTVTSSTSSANFSGTSTNNGISFNFDPPIDGVAVINKPFLMGYIAVKYQYDGPSTPVPGPLPLFGAAAAFGWSRRLKKRISSVA